MNREIKFRGRKNSTKAKEWIHGSLIIDNNNKPYAITQPYKNPVHNGILQGWVFRIISETVGQFTGLQDKNGIDIYEGDIVLEFDKENSIYIDVYKTIKLKSLVEWDNCNPCFRLTRLNSKYSHDVEYDFIKCEMKTLEIIGNIHENKDLL